MSSLPIIDKFLHSVLSVLPVSDSTDALVSWFCDNSPQSVYKLVKSCSRANTVKVRKPEGLSALLQQIDNLLLF